MSTKPRKRWTPEEKRDIVLHALRQEMTQSELCRHYGIYPSDLARWKTSFLARGLEGLKDNGKSKPPIAPKEYERLLREKTELERVVIDQSIEIQLLKKKSRLNLVGSIKGTWLNEEIKHALICAIDEAAFNKGWSINKACKVIGLNPDRYYAWKRKDDDPIPPSGVPLRVHRLLPEEKEAILKFAEKYPTERHRKLSYLLLREAGIAVSPSSVYRVLLSKQLVQCWIKDQRIWKKKDLKVTGPNQVWRSDITYIDIGAGYGYLIIVLDKFSVAS